MTRDDRNRSSSGGTLRNQPTPVISKSRNRPRNVKEPKSPIENDKKMKSKLEVNVYFQRKKTILLFTNKIKRKYR